MSDGQLLSALEIAEELGINERTVRRWIGEGRIEAEKDGGRYRISLEAARAALAGTRADHSKSRALLDRYVEWLEEENARLWALLEKAVSR